MSELRELTQSEIEREQYEARRKMQMDIADAIHAATQKGLEKGRAQGELIGAIRLCQEQLGLPVVPAEDLTALSEDELRQLAESLKQQLLG